jgi:hypothetical protein
MIGALLELQHRTRHITDGLRYRGRKSPIDWSRVRWLAQGGTVVSTDVRAIVRRARRRARAKARFEATCSPSHPGLRRRRYRNRHRARAA